MRRSTIDQAVELSAARRPAARVPRRPVPGPPDDRADPRCAKARRRSAAAISNSGSRSRPATSWSCWPTSSTTWRGAGGKLRRPGAEGRGPHARTERIAGAADRDVGGAAGHLQARRASSKPVFQAMLKNATRICSARLRHVLAAPKTDGLRVVAFEGVVATYAVERMGHPFVVPHPEIALGPGRQTRNGSSTSLI